MNTKKLPVLILLIALLPLTSAAAAQEPDADPQLPGTPLAGMFSALNPANWKMPKMSTFLPSKKEKERVITKKNSLVDEMSITAKQSWQRTKTTLNPMRLIPAGFKTNSQTKPAPKKEGGFWSNLFAPFPKSDRELDKPDVNDFLRQDPIR